VPLDAVQQLGEESENEEKVEHKSFPIRFTAFNSDGNKEELTHWVFVSAM
jgi:hypothetical protein